jgi:hypothetical protein
MHDFHLGLVLGMVSGEREIPEWLDLRAFLEHFTGENSHPPSFNRSRLERTATLPPSTAADWREVI